MSASKRSTSALIALLLTLTSVGVLSGGAVPPVSAATDSCTVNRSTPGCEWTIRTSADDSEWISVAYGNGLWVAVAAAIGTAEHPGTHQIMTSSDGITWTARTAAAVSDWRSVAYGNGLWVAVASSGTDRVMTSTDGINWTARTAASASFWRGVVYGEDANGDGLWVAVATGGTDRVMTSTDGITWTARTSPENSWFALAYGKGGDGNGLWVATAIAGSTSRVMTSPDGIQWTARTSDPACCNHYFSVAFGEGEDGTGLWVAVSNTNNAPGSRVMTSPDGITWTAGTATSDSQWRGVAYGNGLWVAVAAEGPDRVMTSPDGITWTARAAANDNGWRSVAYAIGVWVAVALSGEGDRVMTSGVMFVPPAPSTEMPLPVPGPGFVVAEDGSVPVVSPGGALVLDASGRALEAQMSLVSGSGGGVTIVHDDGNGMALSVIAAGDRGATQSLGPIAAFNGSFEVALAFGDGVFVPDGEVVEVWMFSTPRLVAAGRLGPDGRVRISVPLAAPLDGGEAIPAGAHTLQVLIPSRGGRMAVNVGVTVGGPVPVSVPAGEGPVPVWPLLVSILVGVVVLRRVSSAGVLG
jgi:hypothetical protein